MKKQIVSTLSALLICTISFAGCGKDKEEASVAAIDSQPQTEQSQSTPSEDIQTASANFETIEVIDILGTIHKDGKFEKRPWYTYETERENIDGKSSGEYVIVQKDSSGGELSKNYFDISFFTQSNPPKETEFMPVMVTIPYEKNAASIEILKGTASIHKVDISPNKPEISFGEMKGEYEGKAEIIWDASDKDGGDIFYEVWYATDNEDFISLATDIKESKLTVDFSTLPGSDAAYIYVYATDGVNTSGLDSPEFIVGYKPPEIISKQDSVPEYKLTDEIQLDADVYDKQDGWLYEDKEVSWLLKGKEYTTGSLLWIWPYELSPGTHTFTLKATNSKGIEETKDFSFKVIDDESALPNDWSKEDIQKALANGFVAPLANVNSAITRGQFAKLMANLYWTVWEEGSPDPEYEENIVTDCGQDDYDQFLMVNLGVMDAPGGKFKPNGNVTEEEASTIMYKICQLADPNLLDDLSDPADITSALMEYGVMDDSGDNGYGESDKITGRLALVRCNRLYDAIFEAE